MSSAEETVAKWVTFFVSGDLAQEASEEEWEPAGRLLATSLAKGLEAAGFTTDRFDNYGDYAWHFFASYDKTLWDVQVGSHDQVDGKLLMAVVVRRSSLNLFDRGRRERVHRVLLETLAGVLASDDRITSPRWFTEHQYETLNEGEWMSDPFGGKA
jgi:hypothetical protein